MKIKSLYITSLEPYSGTLFVSMGFMDILRRRVKNIAFFRPIVLSKEDDNIASFMLKHYKLDMTIDQALGFTLDEVKSAAAKGKLSELTQNLIAKFKEFEQRYDFVICGGIERSLLPSTFDFDINLEFAKHLGTPVVNIISGKERESAQIAEAVNIEANVIKNSDCTHFNTFINRLDTDTLKRLKANKKELFQTSVPIHMLPEVEDLNSPTIEDIKNALKCKFVFGKKEDLRRVVKQIRVVSTTIDTMLTFLKEGDLIITGGDRSDIILAAIMANSSGAYPMIAGILLSGNTLPKNSFLKLIEGFSKISIPILSAEGDTISTLFKAKDIQPQIKPANERKIALISGLFNKYVKTDEIEKNIDAANVPTAMTPIMFEYTLFERARQNRQRIVLPESNDDRILRASEILLRRGAADIILLGKPEDVTRRASSLGIDIKKATIIEPEKSELMEQYIKEFYELRKSKGITLEQAREIMQDCSYFGTMMVHKGDADGMVSGAIHTTSDTIRPALQIIKTKPGISIISSVFFMCLDTKVLVYGDCAVNKDPSAEELAQIAASSADTAKSFGIEPKTALLSYSTGNSGSGEDVEKVRLAVKLAKESRPDLLIEGPIQYDAAIDPTVAKTKLPESKVAGQATVFIFPDLNTGNNTYKAVQRSSNALAIGPVLQGLKKPVNDLSRGCLVADIVNTVVITAIQAAQIKTEQ
ncbi:MAG: phosphate acetyltransferase [Campylobacteraceae bacterium]|jgi:phosphate acetyltransferase|nr:phosphate acetyltransferase [Campylobacteraceae bacterium]